MLIKFFTACLLFSTLFFNKLQSQELIVIESDYLKGNDSVLVFTPKGYNPLGSCHTPALFLLHGWSGAYSDWHRKADIQKFSDKYGFIIITPDGFYNSWYLNNIDKEKMQWRSFFDNELYPLIIKRYNLNSANTFITGLSMGGHGAINIFIDDPSRFKAAGSMSGVLNLHDSNSRLKENQISEVLGPYNNTNHHFDDESAINRLELLKGSKGSNKMLIISCGTQDYLAKSSYDFSEECNRLDIPNTLIISPGVHSWDYWIFALDLHLFLFTKLL